MKKLLLKQKIAALFFLGSLLVLVIVGVTVSWYMHKTLVDNKESEILSIATEQSHESYQVFKNNQLFVHLLSTNKCVTDFLSNHSEEKRKDLLDLFSRYSKENKKYLAIYLLDKDGTGLISTDPRFVGQDYSFRDYFKQAMTGQSTVDIAIGKTSKQFGYYFAEPVLEESGEILGVMVAKVDESDIDDPIISSEITKGNIFMLVDKFGVVLASMEKDRKLKSLGILSDQEKGRITESNRFLDTKILPLQYDLVQQNLRNYKTPVNIKFYDEKDKDEEIVNLIQLKDLPFYLVTEIRLEYVNSQIIETVVIIILIILIIILMISLFIFYFLRIFLKPLDKFKSFFTTISNGNFSQEIEIDTNDEFHDLALYVNKMSKDLSSMYKGLEEKVKERTEKLEQTNLAMEKTLEETNKLNKMMVDRELKMIELKKENLALKGESEKN